MKTEHITFTRFLAALPIVIFHFGDKVYPFGEPLLKPLVAHAYLGVSYFFLLSGFVMTLAYYKRNEEIAFSLFMKKRAARILPLYYFALILMLLYFFIRIKILGTPSQYTPTIPDFLANLFLVQAWIPEKAHTINTAAWSLSVEAFFYITFPLFYNKILRRLAFWKVLLFVLAIFVVSQMVLHYLCYHYSDIRSYLFTTPLMHINQFVLGCALGLFFVKYRQYEGNWLLAIILIISLILLSFNYSNEQLIYSNGLYLILFIPLLFFIGYDNGPLSRLFSHKVCVYLGEISYGIYILQFPVYFFFTAGLTFIGYKINQPLFYVYLLALVIVSALSYNWIEKPLREKIRKV